MNWEQQIDVFYKRAVEDSRLGPLHISLFFALAFEVMGGIEIFIPVKSRIMQRAKISSTVTYHKCLRELSEYGYISYRPSYAAGRTRVEMIQIGE